MITQPQLYEIRPDALKGLWSGIPRAAAMTEAALRQNGCTFPVPRSLKYVSAGPLAPDGKPALAYRYQSKAQPWAGISRLPLRKDLRGYAGEPIVFTTDLDEMTLRASVRFRGAPNALCVVAGMPFALARRQLCRASVWAFVVLTDAVADEIPRAFKCVEVLTPRGGDRRGADALTAELRRRGHTVIPAEFRVGRRPRLN
jgi:hypothetical protein